MIVDRLELRSIRIPLREPFEISAHRFTEKTALVLKGYSRDGLVAWAEGEHLETPWYSAETVESGLSVLRSLVLPSLVGRPFRSIEELEAYLAWIQGNNLSLALVYGLFHDFFAQEQGLSLARSLGAMKKAVPAGVSIGLRASGEELAEAVSQAREAGYRRFKLKVKPGKDVVFLAAVRKRFPDIPVMVDANAAYRLEDVDHLAAFDDYGLTMIEQPLGNGDLVDHAALAGRIRTPICLDESIHSLHDARAAAALGACSIVNIKPPRIGGPGAVRRMQDYLASKGITVWCGGMLEAGIGRALNLACAGLSNFAHPGDLSPPLEYLEYDIVEEPFTMNPDGTVEVPDKPGLGVTVEPGALKRATVAEWVFP